MNDIPDWRQLANCATTDPEIFFISKGDSPRPAQKICANCDVVEQCLRYAQRVDPVKGIYGGLTAYERKKLRSTARKAA